MPILGYYIFCLGGYCTIHKLIVIRISFYQVITVLRIYKNRVRSSKNGIDYICRYNFTDLTCENLFIFENNFIRNTKIVLTRKEV